MSDNTTVVIDENEKNRRLKELYKAVGTYTRTRGLPMTDVNLGLIIAISTNT